MQFYQFIFDQGGDSKICVAFKIWGDFWRDWMAITISITWKESCNKDVNLRESSMKS